MNILFLVPYVPNLIRVRPYNLIRSLTARGHRVTVMTLINHEEQDVEKLREYCHRVHAHELPTWRSLYNLLTAFPSSTPLQSVYCWQPDLASHSAELLTDGNKTPPFDVIHIEHLRGARYGLHLKERLSTGGLSIPIVWDSVDCITHLFEQAASRSQKTFSRWITRFELGRTRRYERYLINQFDRVLVTSEVDKHALLSLIEAKTDSAHVSVLPNGVDLEYFNSREDLAREEATIVVSGKMSYHANETMVLYLVNQIMPIVWRQRPDVKLWIAGKDPSKEIRELAQNPAVTVTGTVEDMRPYLQSATVSVTPIQYGAGIQNKVLEAMACSTPVVSAPQAIGALEVKPGQDLMVADEPGEYAEKILLLINNQEIQRNLGEAGRRYVEKYHNWNHVAGKLEEIYREEIRRKQNIRNL